MAKPNTPSAPSGLLPTVEAPFPSAQLPDIQVPGVQLSQWRHKFDYARDPYAARNALSAQTQDGDLDALAALTGVNTIYFRSGNNAWSPVTIGTNLSFSGGVLAASSRALEWLANLTASASATLDFTGISATYDEYMFELVNIVPAAAPRWLIMRYQVGGTFQATNYGSAIEGSFTNANRDFNTPGSGGVEVETTGIILSGSNTIFSNPQTTAGQGLSGSIKLFGPNTTNNYKYVCGNIVYMFVSAGNFPQVATVGGAYMGGQGAVTGVRFLFSTGNIASGEVRVYGLRKS